MIIAVASGKGGTGKTAIATSLSAAVEDDVHHLDCDVENPNSYLYMKPSNNTTKRAVVKIPQINTEKCTRCDKCVDACKYGALVDGGIDLLFLPNLCHSCAACWVVCPEDAITPIPREFGTITTGVTLRDKPIIFTEGRLDITETLTPSMISRTKDEMLSDKLIILDGPPGAGCPLTETVEGADFVILVTEPTVFGLHDLERAYKLVAQVGVPTGVVINRADIGNAPVREFCEQNNIPVLMEIPFAREIAEQYSNGELLIDIVPTLKEQFLSMYSVIKEAIA